MRIEMPDNARPISSTSEKFAAYISRYNDCAMVYIFRRVSRFSIDFDDCVANYETLAKGATASARKEIKKLEKEAK